MPLEPMLITPPAPAPLRLAPWRTMWRVVRVALALFLAYLVVGNLVIAAAWQLQSRWNPAAEIPGIEGIDNLYAVDDHVWRSAAVDASAYEGLARAGVRTIVDLRAEEDLEVDAAALHAHGIRWVHLPIRDGQVPGGRQVERFLATVRDTDGVTLVHCGAGVGRTGAMVAAYLVATGASDGRAAMQRNLAVGPPSLEQLAFAAKLDEGVQRPNAVIVAASRVLDAPRRLWSRYGL